VAPLHEKKTTTTRKPTNLGKEGHSPLLLSLILFQYLLEYFQHTHNFGCGELLNVTHR